jgi:mono/diheme cytochrome c family protein
MMLPMGIAATIALAIHGCGGGSAGDPAPPPTTAVARGAITSATPSAITLGGVTVDTTRASVTTVDNTDLPTLKPGMVVTVKGTFDDNTHARANSVEVDDALKGPVSAIDPAGNRLTVLGQAILFDPVKTVFDDFSGPGLAGVAPGMMVQVSGFADNAGTLVATRIERHRPDWTPAALVELKGTVLSIGSDNTLVIGRLTVDFSGLQLPAGTAAGTVVRVDGRIPSLASTVLKATRIQKFREEPPEAEGKRLEVEGIVSGLSGNSFLVGTTPVNSGALSLAGVANGVRVEVEGTLVGGVLFAAQISVETAAPPPTTAPAAPAGVTATGGFRQVTIAWPAVSGATSYNIYWSTTTGVSPSTGTKIANAVSPYVQMGLADGTTYFYVVTAVNAVGESLPSARVSAATTTAPVTLPPPLGVAAVGGARQVTVSWAPVTGAVSYRLYWSTTTGVTPANGTRIDNVVSPFVQSGLLDSTTYFYVITAVNAAGESLPSAQASATTSPAPATVPAAPVGVVAVGGDNRVTLSWGAVATATTYRIYWSTTTGVTPATGTPIDNATSPFVQTGLAPATTYFYVVTASNAAGESLPSLQASATTNPPAPAVPPAPGGVSAVGGTNEVTLSWGAVPGATSYNLYWSLTTGVTPATGTQVPNVTSPYPHGLLSAGTAYFYVLTAVNGVGESLPSVQVSATTSALDGVALYAANCAGCHNPLATSNKRGGETVARIRSAINGDRGGMGFLSFLTDPQLQAIADVLNF